jgi:ABC-type transport system involved in cytochrome bd biosynthesis fused ATPase/permease subunit
MTITIATLATIAAIVVLATKLVELRTARSQQIDQTNTNKALTKSTNQKQSSSIFVCSVLPLLFGVSIICIFVFGYAFSTAGLAAIIFFTVMIPLFALAPLTMDLLLLLEGNVEATSHITRALYGDPKNKESEQGNT